jgi:ABC-type sugar transport system ATPase subunit
VDDGRAGAGRGAATFSPGAPHVELRGISKRFGGAQALVDVSLTIRRGTIHGLVGENGAGKSTLGKVIAGVHRADSGELLVAGRPTRYRTPREALEDGTTIIAQELSLVPQLSVFQNVFLGVEASRAGLVSDRSLRRRFAALNTRTGFDLPAEVRTGSLGIAEQQKVELLRALARDASLIVMDEPTASLTSDESEKLFEIVRRLREDGVTVIYVSHFLEEVLQLVDEVTVLKDGHLVRTSPVAEETPARLVEAMLGRQLASTRPTRSVVGDEAPVVLSVRGLCRDGVLEDISFDVRAGEIVALAGLIGSGRSEVARAVFGADQPDAGTIELDGRRLAIRRPHDAVRAGIAMLPESRKDQGLLMRRSIVENVSLPHLGVLSAGGIVSRRRELRQVSAMTSKVDVRSAGLSARVTALSGGNQQKVLFAKWLFQSPRVLILDEPTRGVDVGAKLGIHELIVSLSATGMAVLLISSEIEEVLALAHRVLVMRGGRVVGEFAGDAIAEDAILHAAFATEPGEHESRRAEPMTR